MKGVTETVVINNVRIFLQDGESNLKATATVLVNNQILLQSIRVFQDVGAEDGKSEPWVSYPVQKMNNGNFQHCMYPSNAEARKKFNAAILEAYHKVVAGEVDGNTVIFSDSKERPAYEITRASIFPSGHSTQVRAKVGLELDGEIWLRGMRMLVRENGSLFLNMPQRQMGEGERHMAYFHPVDQEARNILTAAAMPFYEAALPAKR